MCFLFCISFCPPFVPYRFFVHRFSLSAVSQCCAISRFASFSSTWLCRENSVTSVGRSLTSGCVIFDDDIPIGGRLDRASSRLSPDRGSTNVNTMLAASTRNAVPFSRDAKKNTSCLSLGEIPDPRALSVLRSNFAQEFTVLLPREQNRYVTAKQNERVSRDRFDTL